jgi:hypothetical protein
MLRLTRKATKEPARLAVATTGHPPGNPHTIPDIVSMAIVPNSGGKAVAKVKNQTMIQALGDEREFLASCVTASKIICP